MTNLLTICWSGCNWWSGVTGGSSAVTWGHNPLSPITRDRVVIETRKWCHVTWLAMPLRNMWILTYLGPDFDLTWPEVRFWNWHFKVKKDMFRTGSTRQTRWCHFIFLSLMSKSYQRKPSPWKTITFHLMTSGAKTVYLRSNLIEKRYRGMKRALQCLFNSS